MIQAYNDWHVDEWCGAYPDRFIPCGILPLFDAELAAAEVRRLAAKGCHAVTFSENPEALEHAVDPLGRTGTRCSPLRATSRHRVVLPRRVVVARRRPPRATRPPACR